LKKTVHTKKNSNKKKRKGQYLKKSAINVVGFQGCSGGGPAPRKSLRRNIIRGSSMKG